MQRRREDLIRRSLRMIDATGSRRWAAATAIEIRWWRRPGGGHSDQQTSGPDCAAWWCRTKLTLGVRRFGRPERILSGPLSEPGKQLAATPRPRQDVPQASSSVSHKVTTSRIRDGGDWSGAHHGLITRRDRSHVKTGDGSHVKTDMLRRTPTHPSRPTRRARPSDLGEHWEHCCRR